MPWTPVVGRRAAAGLRWLEQIAGARAVQKFLGGKVRHPGFPGHYLCGITDSAEGRRLIADLLDQLRQGEAIPLCDVGSYYAAGRCWPLGMAVRDGRLVDIWPESNSPMAATEPRP